ncbi:armadillo-type protein [Lineolata rhizophorae]|uniref:AP-3 complex subunit delta n=1 Tax=Lineolata rhizophorae TaxID=578093 RepID=A0A6A6NTT7_9PEZI|nr:armadillo-type protein [Lineolata rhizophorae]
MSLRFEKSLYDLIRGLRNHKGNEREYIQASIRECRKEIKSQDMDVKATALLKLTYLEMFGHDMSWAAFNVLEVMSSAKYQRKRVGYLAAIQSFRPDTEVLMLAENQLKKDLNSPTPTIIALPLTAIPHVISPSMAYSLLSDLLPRLTHSHAAIRKKTIVTLYRLALVYPETLRPAWPKIKDRLLDDGEDPSVTSAVVNVVCELGWRRPDDFLPLAPRLFTLLVDGNNNWMAIKIIKLFATLIPLEPRLIKKLLSPLTNLIKTTPAMSLLYECINGIIQGGILDGVEGTVEGDEIARLCVNKLRGMLVVEGDPNLKYVALLAFGRVVSSHPQLVAMQQDVILECIDDLDISIRMRALDLVVGMVGSDNLTTIVERLMRQLRNAPVLSSADDPANERSGDGIVPAADSDTEDPEESLRPAAEQRSNQAPPLPEDYRITVIERILDMCSKDTYANMLDFDWYIDTLIQLVKVCPATSTSGEKSSTRLTSPDTNRDVSYRIGAELQNVAVRVRTVRPEATAAAESLILIEHRARLFPASGNGGQGVLEAAAWIAGEYPRYLRNATAVLSSLLHSSTGHFPPNILATAVHAILKLVAAISGDESTPWSRERKSTIQLLLARVVHFLEPLSTHPDLEVQERVVGYLELIRLANEAAASQPAGEPDGWADPPLLLTQAIPSLFSGQELNPVAPGAQKKVPLPEGLDLNAPINPNLPALLSRADDDYRVSVGGGDEDAARTTEAELETVFYAYWNKPPAADFDSAAAPAPVAAADRLDDALSYQHSAAAANEVDSEAARRRAEHRRERYRDDPFYIGGESGGSARASATGTPLHSILRSANGEELDLDDIPIMDLELEGAGGTESGGGRSRGAGEEGRSRKRAPRRRVEIAGDETLGGLDDLAATGSSRDGSANRVGPAKAKARGLLQVDSSGLGSLSLSEDGGAASGKHAGPLSKFEAERREAQEAEDARVLREVERLRAEIQRSKERIVAKEAEDGDDGGGVLVKRKKKKKASKRESGAATEEGRGDENGSGKPQDEEAVVKRKKKKKAKSGEGGGVEGEVRPKRRKKKSTEGELALAEG